MDSTPALWGVCLATGFVGGLVAYFFEKVGKLAIGGLFAALMAYISYLIVLHLIPDSTNATLYVVVGVSTLVGMFLGFKAHKGFLLIVTSVTGSFCFVSGIDILTKNQLNYSHLKHGHLDPLGWSLIAIWIVLSIVTLLFQKYFNFKKCFRRQKAQELASPLLSTAATNGPIVSEIVATQVQVPTRVAIPVMVAGHAGLANLGNTCFLNAAVQALNAVSPLRQYFSDGKVDGKVTNLLASLTQRMNAAHAPSINSSELSQLLSHLNFADGRQHDSFELTRGLVNAMIEDVPKDAAKNVPKDIFSFETFGVVRCDVCGNQSATKEECVDLSLEMPVNSPSVVPLENLMTQYFKPTIFVGENRYHCEKCNGFTTAKRTLHLGSFPRTLIVSLNRFRYSPSGDRKIKLLTQVSIPSALLVSSMSYGLEAVVVHSGTSTEAGHYYAFAKLPTTAQKREWFRCDDRSVTNVDFDEVTSTLCRSMSRDCAYYLFYSK